MRIQSALVLLSVAAVALGDAVTDAADKVLAAGRGHEKWKHPYFWAAWLWGLAY